MLMTTLRSTPCGRCQASRRNRRRRCGSVQSANCDMASLRPSWPSATPCSGIAPALLACASSRLEQPSKCPHAGIRARPWSRERQDHGNLDRIDPILLRFHERRDAVPVLTRPRNCVLSGYSIDTSTPDNQRLRRGRRNRCSQFEALTKSRIHLVNRQGRTRASRRCISPWEVPEERPAIIRDNPFLQISLAGQLFPRSPIRRLPARSRS